MKIVQYFDLETYCDAYGPRVARGARKVILETQFEATTRANQCWMACNKGFPLLYDSGVVYERDPRRKNGRPLELWLDAPTILRRGKDDCEGLSCYLAAEMRMRAPNSIGDRKFPAARVMLKTTKRRGLWHAVVIDEQTGKIYDPSRRLGMGRKAPEYGT